jgi:hypothetical protein
MFTRSSAAGLRHEAIASETPIHNSATDRGCRWHALIRNSKVNLSGCRHPGFLVALGGTLTSPGIGEGFRDNLVVVFVHDVTETLLAEHPNVVSVSLEHHLQSLHP